MQQRKALNNIIMKIVYKSLIMCFAMALFTACGGSSNGGGHGHHHHEFEEEEQEHEHEHEHGHDHDHEHEGGEHAHGGNEISFSPEKAKQFGVKSQEVKAGEFHETIKVSGQIIGAQGDEYTVVASSAGVVSLRKSISVGSHVGAGQAVATVSAKNIVGGDSNEQARILYNNAKRELERLKPLYEDKIVTARDYNAALENYEHAKAAMASSRAGNGGVATTAISGTVVSLDVTDGQYVEAGAPIAKVSKNARLVLRADLPASYAKQVQNIKSANFRTSDSDEMISLSDLKGRRISGNSVATSQPGYIPVCFEFANNGRIVSGAYAEVYLIGAERANTLSIPVKALTEELGTFYVYVQLGEDCYEKRRVQVGISDGCNVEVLSGLKAGEHVVVEGAMVIKLAGSGGAIPGHTHEH